MVKIIRMVFIIAISFVAVYISVLSLSPAQASQSVNLPKAAATALDAFSADSSVGLDGQPFQDNQNIYQYDDPGSVVTIYVTVRQGDSSNNVNHTWQEINDITKYSFGVPINDDVVEKLDATVQFGDENGPVPGEVGYGAMVPNATIQIRGAITSLVAQKSYKIELRSSAGKWRGQSTINLNKHPFDDTRFRNKLNFDLLKEIPNMSSLRTQFVHLYVKDETTEDAAEAFIDYGLYTQVEQPNKKFLRNHLFDPDGQLYKAVLFEFARYPDQIRPADDPLYDEDAFSTILEIKGNKNHSKLIQMLDDVNNYDLPIEQTFAKYFDSNNYFTWLAYNILVGNLSTENQNFYLYSPHNGTKWYFLPWDYDGSFPLQGQTDSAYAPWESGVSNYWSAILPNRLLRVPKYRQALDDKINELRGILTPERIDSLLDVYKQGTDPYVSRMPDLEYLEGTLKSRDLEIEKLPEDIQTNYEMYLESLKKPMPFSLGTPKIADGKLVFAWDTSYDFINPEITYHFAVSTDWEFNNIVTESTLSNTNQIQIDILSPGTYFWRVTAENTSGQTQVPYDYYVDADSIDHYGIKYLYITPDGQALEK